MKSNKVLLGLFVGIFALAGGSVSAQSTFHEVGPANVGGHVSSLVLDQRDESHTTVYAGAIAGGLFVRSENDDILTQLYNNIGRDASIASNHNLWHQVPYMVDGKEVTLPITSMVQGPDNTVYIGTGDNTYQVGSMFGRMSVLGHGIYRYNPETSTFTMVPNTKPTSVDHRFAAVKELAYLYRDNKLYFFAVTGTGLYRWVINSESDWNTAPTEVFAGEIGDLELVRARRVAYFTVGNKLYKIGDVSAATLNCVEISASNSAFGGTNVDIKLASSTVDPSYLYAMVIDENGRMENLYLTTNEQTWTTLTTETVVPMTTGAGTTCGAMVVDPGNPGHIYIGGSTLWSGEGYIPGSYYQWTKSSYSENELNGGDYMSTVYSNAMFVHSGIHQILPVYSDGEMIYYIATDGGVYMTYGFNYFESINAGMNNVQINDLAVSPDGSIISGAVSNSNLMIEARLAHNAVHAAPTWYDAAEYSNFNHDANIIFIGNGGKVAASKFQQVEPQNRRQIYVSNAEGGFGRTYADYLDFTNTQTWTYDYDFVSNVYAAGYPTNMGNIYLWETTNNTIFDDTITFGIDTLGYILRRNGSTYDTVWIGLSGMTTGGVFVRDEAGRITDTTPVGTGHGANFRILAGDKVNVNSRAHSDYPFEYTFAASQLASQRVKTRNPIQSRVLIVGRDTLESGTWRVCISPRATDFTKVFNPGMDYPTQILWYPIYEARTSATVYPGMQDESGFRPRALSMNSDGRFVYIAVNDIKRDSSMILRVKGFENANYTLNKNADYVTLGRQLNGLRENGSSDKVVSVDTLHVNGSSVWFPRQISSIRYVKRGATENLLVTFEGYNANYANVAIVDNCTADSWSVSESVIAGHSTVPAYCAMQEKTTGNIYVGTSDGVFYRSGNAWNVYDKLQNITVTAMEQQQDEMPVRHMLGHNGINPLNYIFAKTKWPNAMYFGTYGRGIFVDMQYVTDTTNEVVDPADLLEIPTVRGTMAGSLNIFPNPVVGEAHMTVAASEAGVATLRIYDLNGRCVSVRQLGHVNQGEQTFTVSTEGMAKGMYLVNVIIGGRTSVAKMMVR